MCLQHLQFESVQVLHKHIGGGLKVNSDDAAVKSGGPNKKFYA